MRKLTANKKGEMTGSMAAMVITLIMAVIVAGVIITNVNTDAILGSTTSDVTTLQNIVLVAFTLTAVGVIALVGKYIISIFT